MKPFLILQLRPETDASDGEYSAILDKTGLTASDTCRIQLDRQDVPNAMDVRDFSGVIVGGGPGCVSDAPETKSALDARCETAMLEMMPAITQADHPFMGCCYGIGILAHHLGASVSKSQFGEPVGATMCELTDEGRHDPLLSGLPEHFEAFVGHKEAVQHLPHGSVHLLASAPCPFQMIRYGQNVYATQFHPEADAHDFEDRIKIYRGHGYFPPEEAQSLIDACHASDVRVPQQILERFVERYARP